MSQTILTQSEREKEIVAILTAIKTGFNILGDKTMEMQADNKRTK